MMVIETKDIIDFILRLLGLVVSWQVILLAIVFLFRQQFSDILPTLAKRIKKISAGGSEAEFEAPQIVDTPLGKAEVSKITVKSSNEIVVLHGIQCTYVDRIYDFKISWPSNHWAIRDAKETQKIAEKSEELAEKKGLSLAELPFAMPIVIERRGVQNDFNSAFNINVVVGPIGNIQIDQLIDSTIDQFKKIGFQLQGKPQISEDKKEGAFISFISQLVGSNELFQFQRIIIDSGKGYYLTATLPNIPNDPNFPEIKNEMLAIINSFRIITYAP